MRVLMNFRVLLLVLLLLAVVGCKQQQQNDSEYNQAINYYSQENFKKSYELMLKSAENGNIDAQYGVAVFYHNGIGVDQDVLSAIKWYEKAASNGHVSSMYSLSQIYLGEPIKDCLKAVQWLERAVDDDSVKAMLMLSGIYKNGTCGVVDVSKSDYYMSRANAEKSNYLIVVEANDLFWGNGGEQNRILALNMVKELYYEYPSDVAYMYGVAYSHGYGVRKDKDKAFAHFKVAALSGNTIAQYNLGVFLYNGRGVIKDKGEAVKWIKIAAKKQYKKALTFMGYMYEIGELGEKDIDKAKEYYRKAVELGDERAQKRLDNLK